MDRLLSRELDLDKYKVLFDYMKTKLLTMHLYNDLGGDINLFYSRLNKFYGFPNISVKTEDERIKITTNQLKSLITDNSLIIKELYLVNYQMQYFRYVYTKNITEKTINNLMDKIYTKRNLIYNGFILAGNKCIITDQENIFIKKRYSETNLPSMEYSWSDFDIEKFKEQLLESDEIAYGHYNCHNSEIPPDTDELLSLIETLI